MLEVSEDISFSPKFVYSSGFCHVCPWNHLIGDQHPESSISSVGLGAEETGLGPTGSLWVCAGGDPGDGALEIAPIRLFLGRVLFSLFSAYQVQKSCLCFICYISTFLKTHENA